MSSAPTGTREHGRLEDARVNKTPWRKWGPYLSERQWGGVRENVNPSVEAWNDLTHDQARSRAYHSGEDGIAGFCDENMLLCFALGLWNGKDAIIKERMFGLTNSEGNHGEDVKEYYFYVDSTPTHSYAKMLYKYPQAAYPYLNLVEENRRRSREEFEYELMDTGVFDEDRYWDVFVEFAKEGPEDIDIKITAVNRGPEAASLHVLPHLWFRNTWFADPQAPRPTVEAVQHPRCAAIAARHEKLGQRYLYIEKADELLFTDNETNFYRLWGQPNPTEFQKDGINDYVVQGRQNGVNPAKRGTKAAAHTLLNVGPGQSATLRLRLTDKAPSELVDPFGSFDQTFNDRLNEADEFYRSLIPSTLSPDAASVIRQGYAGLLWTKQAYVYDVERWLNERGVQRDSGGTSRNQHWFHMYTADVISMPDKWEYPWFAAWDLAFHAVALAMVDPEFAKEQIALMLLERYQHPNGALPAYEWNFDDVNPPVHAWAALFNYRLNRRALGDDALPFLKRTFNMLLPNFTWWLNRKDRDGRNLFEGGFLGLDNIGVFDRSSPLPTGGYLEQADGTAWMAFYAQVMMEISIELALVDDTYEDLAVKFYEQVVNIAYATNRTEVHDALWDDEDGFFYDVLRVPGQFSTRLKTRSIVGLLPLCAVTVFNAETILRLPRFVEKAKWLKANRPELLGNIHQPGKMGPGGHLMISLLDEDKLRRVLARLLDPAEFLGDHGIRSLSRYHLDHPYVFHAGSTEYRVSYLPAESNTGMFGGNSNWRGPIWAPMNILIVRALMQLYSYYGEDFRVECPTGSGQYMTLYQAAQEISNRLGSIFLRDHTGWRPVYGGTKKFVDDPKWNDYVLFNEYFHGDNGAGLGASHQTGWTATIPALMHLFASITPEMLTEREHVLDKVSRERVVEAPGVGA
ncbi:MAG TPA: glucosidase [Polyangia bacterium]|nr:glucosidase [Polyangia bacterium]